MCVTRCHAVENAVDQVRVASWLENPYLHRQVFCVLLFMDAMECRRVAVFTFRTQLIVKPSVGHEWLIHAFPRKFFCCMPWVCW
jgi:hypothetical protein